MSFNTPTSSVLFVTEPDRYSLKKKEKKKRKKRKKSVPLSITNNIKVQRQSTEKSVSQLYLTTILHIIKRVTF